MFKLSLLCYSIRNVGMPKMRLKIILAMLILIVLVLSFFYFVFKEQIHSSITGLITARAFIYETKPYNCSINLTKGTNLVSFYCIPDGSKLNSTLRDINNAPLNYLAIYSYVSDEEEDPWNSYNPNLPNWTVQALNEIDRKHGYIIIMNDNQTFLNQGYHFKVTRINLNKGWNLMSYPAGIPKNISEVLSSIEGNYTIIGTYRNGNWLSYNPLTEEGNLSIMNPGESYWINLTKDVELVVNW